VEAMEKRLQPALEDNRGLEHLVRDRLGWDILLHVVFDWKGTVTVIPEKTYQES
jgi:hypothetical protein